jgi:hypothetical protein
MVLALTTSAATIAAGLVGVAATAATTADVSVVWPASTTINPQTDTTAFEVLTTGTDPSTDLFSISPFGPSSNVPVEADGSTVVPLPDVEGAVWITLYRCGTNGCAALAPSHRIELRTRLEPSDNYLFTPYTGPLAPVDPVSFEPAEVTTVDVTWEIFESPSNESSVPVLSGHVDGAPVPFTMPKLHAGDLVHWQLYDVRIHYEADTSWGRLEADSEQDGIRWDEHVDVAFKQNVRLFYPIFDGYRDKFFLTGTWDDEYVRRFDVTVRDEAGQLVYEEDDDDYPKPSGTRLWWEPGSTPDGTYTMTVRITDWAGNTGQVDRKVEVIDQRLRSLEWKRTFRADEVLIAKGVGRCGSLEMPARRAWRGSIGYRTDAHCARPRQWFASTSHGVFLPYSVTDKYWVRVSVYGGKPRSDERSYLKMFYRNRADDDWVDGGQLGDRVGLHDGYEKRNGVVLGQDEQKPYVVWNVGLGGGYNYDVKSFTVALRYQALTY